MPSTAVVGVCGKMCPDEAVSMLLHQCLSVDRVLAFYRDYMNVLHYYTKVEHILHLRRQWHRTGHCPRQLAIFYVLVVIVSVNLCWLPIFCAFPSIDPRAQLVLGNFAMLFGLSSTYALVFFVLALPMPVFHLLLYPYLSTAHYHSLLYSKAQVCQQLARPVVYRQPGFNRFHSFSIYLGGWSFWMSIAFILILNIMVIMFVLDNSNYFFGHHFLGYVRLLCLELNMLNLCACTLAMVRIIFDMFIAIYFASVHTFEDLDGCNRLLRLGTFTWLRMHQFRRAHTTILVRVLSINTILGNILLLFYISNYPTSAYILTTVFFQHRVPLLIRIFLAGYLVHQFMFMIGLHLLAASYR